MAAAAAAAVDVQRRFIHENADADLAFLLDEGGMSLDLQHDLVQAGFVNIRRFTGMADTRVDLRAAAVATFHQDPGTPAGRLQAAILISTWETAKEQLSRETVLRAEAKALQQPRLISNQERVAMRRVIEIRAGRLPDSEVPSAEYLAEKMEQLEQNDPGASTLDSVVSLADEQVQLLDASITPSGQIQVLRRRSRVRLPANSEELRIRLRVEGNTWLFLQTRFLNRTWLQGLTADCWGRYTDYFTGPKVMGLKLAEDTPLNPAWSTILGYEFQCRRAAFELVKNSGLALTDALRQCVRDTELRELHFTASILLGSRGAKRQSSGSPPKQQRPHPKRSNGGSKGQGGSKGGSKGGGSKGTGSGKGGGGNRGGQLLSKTPDGRMICYDFNSPKGCTRPKCSYAHVCRKAGCAGAHALQACPLP